MRNLLVILLFGASALWAQNSGASQSKSSNSQPQDSNASQQSVPHTPNLAPPRSDRVNVDSLDDNGGSSSSKDTRIDLSPPTDDEKGHPHSSDILMDEGTGNGDAGDTRPWDPHKSAKDVEVGDFYFKRKNYTAAEDRYREALYYKDNDALATYRLAICLEKLNRPDEAIAEFENYLKILPHGPEAEDAKKGIERLKRSDPATKAAK